MSSINIPPSNLLQLDNNFSLPPSIDKKFTVYEFIKDLENNNRGFNDACKSKIRASVVPCLENFLLNNYFNDNNELELLNLYKTTTVFYKKNPNVIFTRADKGNVIMALCKYKYIKKMVQLLTDNNTYNSEEGSD